MLDYKVVSLVENKLGEVQDQRERDAMIKYLIQEADFEIAYYLVCTYITKRNVMDLHKSIISNISNSKSTLDLAPRGFGKSTVGDVDYCITRILRDPNIRIMIGSKTQTQAEAFLKEVRTHFEQNEDLIRIFGDWKTSKDNVWNDREFTVNKRSIIKKEATLTALGASGAVISKHFDVIIGDDLVGLENARTEKQRSNLKEWFYSSLFPTLEPDGEIHILGTRYNPLDLYEDLFDIVVIKDQERLQRNTLDWYLFINRVVQTGKLLFMYMDGKFYSPDDALITGVRAIIAEEFSRNLSKKLHNYHDHRIEKARQGQEIALQGSGNVYGWDKKDGKYYINPEQAKVRRLMCEGIMARKGSTLIAKELNDAGYRNTVGKPWKPMDIPKFVYDCKNVGTMIINKERHDFESKQTIKLPKEEWVYVENALPPIVTQEEWDLICKIHEERVIATGSDRRGKKTSGYSFSGKLVCGICGAPYWRKQRVSKDEYWVCSTKQTKGRRTRKRDSTMGKAGEINPLGCDNENISYNSLMEIMGVVSERLQANTDTIKQDMINWLTKLRKQLLEANGGHTEADLQRELSRKSKLLDAYLDGILNKQEYQKKAEELDERIIQLKAETEKNKANSGDIAEIDKVLANIDEEVSRYVDGNEKLKVEYLLEHLEQVQIFPDKVIVIVPILSEGIVVEKTQYVSREKWLW